jgi:hypothetical protein
MAFNVNTGTGTRKVVLYTSHVITSAEFEFRAEKSFQLVFWTPGVSPMTVDRKSSGEALNEQYDNLYLFIGDVVCKGSSSYRLTKSEIDRVLLEGTGLLISWEVLDAIFNEVHADGSGTILKDDLFEYIKGVAPSTKAKQANYVVYNMLTSVAWWMSLFCITGSTSNIVSNILNRVGVHVRGGTGYSFTLLSSWLLGVGTLVFLLVSFERHKAMFELNEEVKRGLHKWVVQDPDKIPDNSDGITASDLGLLLERSSVFVSFHP